MMNRRDWIKTLCLGAGGMMLGRRRAIAATATATPRRLVIVYAPNGLQADASNLPRSAVWVQSDGSLTNFTPTGQTAAMLRHKANMVYLNNISMMADEDLYAYDVHTESSATMLTNVNSYGRTDTRGTPYTTVAGGESIDNYLARTLGQQYTPAFPSIQLGISTEPSVITQWTPTAAITHLQNGSYVFPQRDPVAAYQSLFSAAVPAAQSARQKSVLDYAAGQFKSFQNSLAAEDKARAQAQIAGIETLESRLAAVAASACKTPTAPGTIDLSDGANLPTIAAAQFSLVASAFACDLTRVATVVFGGAYCFSIEHGKAVGVLEDFHSSSHESDPTGLTKSKGQIFTALANFCDQLLAIPEGNGTMLDNTLILVVSEIGDHHLLDHLPWFTVGGKNMGVNVGSYLNLPGAAVPHGCVLRSINAAMGMPDQPFGNPTYSNFQIPGFLI